MILLPTFLLIIIFSVIGYGIIYSYIIDKEYLNQNIGAIGITGCFFLIFISYLTNIFVSHGYFHNVIIIVIGLLSSFNYLIYFSKKKCKKIDTVFDIGGHKGETSLDLLKIFEIKKIFIFEPVLDNFKKMSKNLLKYQDKCEIKKFNFALGDETEEILINKTFESSSSTINQINTQSNYYKRKNKILKFFLKNKDFQTKEKIKIKKTSDFFDENSILSIDLMKIDTEGYEYFILNNLNDKIKKIKAIYFEHHYDSMIIKNYTFSQMHSLLTKNGFLKFYKSRMPFRKSFDYIYVNKEFFNDKI